MPKPARRSSSSRAIRCSCRAVLGEEILRDAYQPRVAANDTVVVDHGSKNGMEIVFLDHDTISHYEPSKGHLIYRRVK